MFGYRANATTEEGAEQNTKTINKRSDCTWKTRKAIGKTVSKLDICCRFGPPHEKFGSSATEYSNSTVKHVWSLIENQLIQKMQFDAIDLHRNYCTVVWIACHWGDFLVNTNFRWDYVKTVIMALCGPTNFFITHHFSIVDSCLSLPLPKQGQTTCIKFWLSTRPAK